MKIAIKGHESRGNEVIQILKSLGGINRNGNTARFENYFYYIDDNNTIVSTYTSQRYLHIYTLEEFEKEFPFKIGETVITRLNHVGIIVGIVYNRYKVQFKEDYALITPHILKLYKEMKEERNITLTLDKAKEWYNKGGELREIALQAFTEKELNPLPRSWKEFCEKYLIQDHESLINFNSSITVYSDCLISRSEIQTRNADKDRLMCPSKKSAEAHLALIQLEQLRDCWRQGWIPKPHQSAYVIKFSNRGLDVYQYTSREFLSFPTKEMAEEFLECFRDLIEKAGDLI